MVLRYAISCTVRCNAKPQKELAPALALIPMNKTMTRDEIWGRTKCKHAWQIKLNFGGQIKCVILCSVAIYEEERG
jgi:hypothetical protein